MTQANVMLTVTSDQNLFENDEIHFELNVTADKRYFRKGPSDRATARSPGGSGASANIALGQLQNYVSIAARRIGLPPFLADNVQALQLIPDAAQMQQRIDKPGTYVLTAYACRRFLPAPRAGSRSSSCSRSRRDRDGVRRACSASTRAGRRPGSPCSTRTGEVVASRGRAGRVELARAPARGAG